VRFSYRLKILFSLLVTTLLLLGGALFAIDRAYQARVEALTRSRVAQGRSNFAELTKRTADQLARDLRIIAKSQRLQLELQERDGKEAARLALDEMEYQDLRNHYVVASLADGKPVARLVYRLGQPFIPGAKPPLALAQGAFPGQALLLEAVARKDTDEDVITDLKRWIVESGRLFHVYPCKIFSGEAFVGVVLAGREVNLDLLDELRRLQQEGDTCGFLVDDKLIAAGFDDAQLTAASSALRSAVAGMHAFDTQIGNHAYRVVLSSEEAEGGRVSTALFISLKELVDFRREMRTLIVGLGGVAVILSILVAVVISRGVTRPVADLAAGTVQIAKGEYGTRIHVRSRDELGDLATAFNRMAEDLGQKEKVRAALNKVVAPEVAEELLKGDLSLGGELVRPTILFADLRGFTALTQGMPPQKVVGMLNEFMTAMTQEVLECKGIVDKYVGDEIIGLFGIPTPRGADALAGVEAAHRMRLRLEKLNRVRQERGDRPLQMGIGVHTGEVVAGRMGSEQQLSYTCIGENMNLASRLCSNAKAGQILISIDTYKEAGDAVEARPLDPIKVKGFDQPIAVYEVASVMIGATAMRRKR
jgi:class 3 adenylate cyclase